MALTDSSTLTDNGSSTRKKSKFSITGVVIVISLIGGMFWIWWSFWALNTVQTYQVIYSSGDFTVKDPSPASSSDEPKPATGTQFQTGFDGFATVGLSDGSTLQLMPGTRLEIIEAKSNSAGDTILTALRMLSGELVSRIAHDDGRDREVTLYSKAVAIGVRGTVFSVQQSNDIARLTVTEGKVEAAGERGDPVLVKLDQGTVIQAGKAPEPVSALLAAPVLQSPVEGASAGPDGLSLAWEKVAGAGNYLIEIAEDDDFARLLRRQEVAWDNGTLANLKQDGQYYWRVAAIDNRGLRGRFSEGQSLQHDAFILRSRAALRQLQVGAVLKNLNRSTQGLESEINALRENGFNLLDAGEFANAKETFSVVLQLLPDDRVAKNGMGRANYLLLDYSSARSVYEEALGKGEGDAGVDAQVGLALLDVREGKFQNALLQMDKILQQQPTHQKALNVSAMAAIGLDQHDQAKSFVQRSLAVDNGDPTAVDLQRALNIDTTPTLKLPTSGKIALPEVIQKKLEQ